jgi:hypothetical protein
VVRIDRLARSLSHLLEIIETLDARGAGFRSLGDPIDTTRPQGRFTLQILGAVTEFERALIRECARAGLKAARISGSAPRRWCARFTAPGRPGATPTCCASPTISCRGAGDAAGVSLGRGRLIHADAADGMVGTLILVKSGCRPRSAGCWH